jgi:predicted dehydrogenase
MSQNCLTSRRRFLQGIATVGAASVMIPATQRALGDQSANSRPVFACIGMRNQGWAITSKTIPFAHFAALADVDEKILAEFVEKTEKMQEKKPDAYKDYRKILDRKDIDAVMIATPDHWHTKIAVEAMQAGKDVYCEKPLTLTIDEGKIIEQAVTSTGRVFQVGTMQRTEIDQRFLQAIALIQDGRIGKVTKVTCGINGMTPSPKIPVAPVPQGLDWDFWLGPAPKVDYRALPEMRQGYGGGVPLYSNCHYAFRDWHEYSGGKLTDWGAHHIDIAQWGLGMLESGPVKIEGVGEYPDDGLWNAAVNYRFDATYDNGVVMDIDNAHRQGVKFIGEEGWVFVKRGAIDAEPKSLLDETFGPNEIHLYPSGDHRRNFLDCMRSRGETAAPIEHAHRSISIAHLGNIAMQTGRAIHWDPATETIRNDPTASRMLGRPMRGPWRL